MKPALYKCFYQLFVQNSKCLRINIFSNKKTIYKNKKLIRYKSSLVDNGLVPLRVLLSIKHSNIFTFGITVLEEYVEE